MSSQQLLPYDWIRSALPELVALNKIPLAGTPPLFPWEPFAQHLAKRLRCEKIDFDVMPLEWHGRDTFFDKIPSTPFILKISPSGYQGAIWWAISKRDLVELMAFLLNMEENKASLEKCEISYLKGFHSYIAMELLNGLTTVHFDQGIVYTIEGELPLEEEKALCLDVVAKLGSKKIFSRIFVSEEFKKSWEQRYLFNPQELMVNSSLAQRIKVVVHLEAGKVKLSKQEWLNTKPGDFLLLDQTTFQQDLSKVKVIMSIQGKPFFRARLKKGSLKILEFPLINQVGSEMVGKYSEEENEIFDEEESDYSQEYGEELSEESELDEESGQEPEASSSHKVPSANGSGSALKNLENMPLQIVLEVGRVEMSIQQIVALQPGNVLEIDIDPEQGVDLVVNGSKIARGELLKLGDHFGVRIIECG